MSNVSDVKEYLSNIGKAMDWDDAHNVYGTPGSEVIPWLHKKPQSFEDTFVAMYYYMRDAGITLTLDYNPDEVDVNRMLNASEIRKRALDGQ